jgi:hypothetical protein
MSCSACQMRPNPLLAVMDSLSGIETARAREVPGTPLDGWSAPEVNWLLVDRLVNSSNLLSPWKSSAIAGLAYYFTGSTGDESLAAAKIWKINVTTIVRLINSPEVKLVLFPPPPPFVLWCMHSCSCFRGPV